MLQTKTFSAGSFAYQSDSNAYVLDLILTEEAVDAAANTSQISCKLQLRSGENNRFNGYVSAALSLDGTQIAKADLVTIAAAYNKTYTLLTCTVTVPHDQDGTLTLKPSGTMQMLGETTSNPYAPPDMTVGGSMVLTAIPRASALAVTSAFIEDAATIVVNRRSAAYSHSIRYQFGALCGYLADNVGTHSDTEVKLTDTTILFPLPAAFYSQIPDRPADSCTLLCTTYAGDTVIGQVQTAFTVTADPVRCGPLVSGTVRDIHETTLALTGNSSILVQGMSRAQCSVEAVARQGAAVTAVYVCGRQITGDTYTIEQVSTADIRFRVTDSRGYTAEYAVPGLCLVPYVPLQFYVEAARTDPTSGDGVLTLQGKWYGGSFGAADNTLTGQYRVDGGTWQSVTPLTDGGDLAGERTLSDLDYRTGHTIEVQLSDALQSITKQVSISRGIPVFDWGEKDFMFHVPVRFTATDGTVFTLDLADGQLIYKEDTN